MSNETSYSEEQQRAAQHFDEISDFWHDVYFDERTYTGYALRQQHEFVVEMVQQTLNVRRVLDVGCGAGVTALELAQKGYDVSGVDIAPNMIERAQQEAQRQNITCDFKVALAESLPYPDGSIDVLIGLGLLGNILDDKPALREMVRVLKPNGRVILTMPNLLALDLLVALPKSLPIMLGSTRFREPLRVLGNIGRRLLGRPAKDVSKLRFNQCVVPQRYTHYLEQHGFRDVLYSPVTFGPMMPFGLKLLSDETAIRLSKKLLRRVNLRSMGTIMVYDGLRV